MTEFLNLAPAVAAVAYGYHVLEELCQLFLLGAASVLIALVSGCTRRSADCEPFIP